MRILFFAASVFIISQFYSCENATNKSDFTFSEKFQNELLEKCISVEDGGTIDLPEGKFFLKKPLSVDGKKNVTIKGQGAGKTFISFKQQTEGGEGMLITNCINIIMEGFTVQDAKGDNIKLLNCDTVTIKEIGRAHV